MKLQNIVRFFQSFCDFRIILEKKNADQQFEVHNVDPWVSFSHDISHYTLLIKFNVVQCWTTTHHSTGQQAHSIRSVSSYHLHHLPPGWLTPREGIQVFQQCIS